MKTLEEVREFIRLWPRWSGHGETTYNFTSVKSQFDHRKGRDVWALDYERGVAFCATIDDFFRRYKRVVVPDHVPVRSWWLDAYKRPFCFIDSGTESRIQRGDGSVLEGAYPRRIHGCARVTPENFPWDAKMDPVMREAMAVAVFGSVELSQKAAPAKHGEYKMKDEVIWWGGDAPETKPVTVDFGVTIEKTSEAIAKNMLGSSVTTAKLRPCIICGRLLGDGQSKSEHALFCSGKSGCGGRAAEAYEAADVAIRFLCGLNLQDHSVKEQREYLDVVRKLQQALRPDIVKVPK